jgi:murein DD-endopeptidase MepM/ murein hydrolase activator NlpD
VIVRYQQASSTSRSSWLRRTAVAAAFATMLAPAPAAGAAATTGGTDPESAKQAQTTASTTQSQPSPSTWIALGKAATALGRRDLKRGMRGSDVKVLQQLLTELGYRVKATGRFDSKTKKQVTRFQGARGLPTVGRVGPATARALRAAHEALRPAAVKQDVVKPDASGWVFPIRGRHDYGDAADRYGAARAGHRHAGQDVLAACGTPLVAARGGKVVGSDYGGGAGNFFAVHTLDSRYDYFYAHLRNRPLLREGQTVKTGELIGYVGETGDAVGCHLHFELWDGAWWNGGKTIDPLPFLKAWDTAG